MFYYKIKLDSIFSLTLMRRYFIQLYINYIFYSFDFGVKYNPDVYNPDIFLKGLVSFTYINNFY